MKWSLEFFPPKTEESLVRLHKSLYHIINAVSTQKPEFVDVTFCAGSKQVGSSSNFELLCQSTLSLSSWIQTHLEVPACPHLVLRGLTLGNIHDYLERMKTLQITHVMALRGDCSVSNTDQNLVYAVDLVKLIRKQYGEQLKIIVASYPEGHPECHGDISKDIQYLEEKITAGADFTITQFFLSSEAYLRFKRLTNPSIKIIPGIILLSSQSGLYRMVKLAGGSITVPLEIEDQIKELNADQMREWGLQFACRLCQELYDAGERFFHIYTLNADDTVCQLIQYLHHLGFCKGI